MELGDCLDAAQPSRATGPPFAACREPQKRVVHRRRPPYCSLATLVLRAGAASDTARVAQLVPAAEIH